MYADYTCPLLSLLLGAFTTEIDTKLSNENTYLSDQAKYLNNSVLSEGAGNHLPKQLEPVKPIINTITNEILNASEGK
ncbi:hypothetical protein Q7469_09255 [Glaesserella parasuis]|uniref:Uncharacterized protein n=1 Tax=Glaesserella parasuis TaxID=738 RepID=A0A6M8SYI0_GLAPU|nr:hypothetical protein [Glaesserella parasuis]MDD2166800.1 hypothetical protein [Glaesserella parasuis]MDD2167336.1 hypothetical protein [Glaesserella parasuis]MDD2172940.1 hypothetical protein [Glaesserella parasuis]MDG6346457.1 hypothetical protein [Glaesserella parasuis]MDG6448906.1 hypothetical protein [Glaesserella parasuis]